MRDYDPTTGRYLQGDPLGLVDGASVYGYALQNPGRYVDPTGELVPIGYVVAAGIGALTGVGTGYVFDMVLGDGCYTWEEFALDAALGATGAGLGARYAWRFGSKSLTRETGMEWSHSISRSTIDDYATRARDFLNAKSNRFPDAVAAANRAINATVKAMNTRGGLNGSWTSAKRHFKHGSNRNPAGHRNMGKRYLPPVQALDRIPDWMKFSGVGGAASSLGGNAAIEVSP